MNTYVFVVAGLLGQRKCIVCTAVSAPILAGHFVYLHLLPVHASEIDACNAYDEGAPVAD